MSVLALADVAFAWRRGKGVLRGLSFEVARGEHLALLGPNGSGKSTALALAAGLYRPDAGSVRWSFDERADHALAPEDPRARARFGVVFQHPSLDLQLSALDNLVLAGQMHGIATARAEKRAAELLELAGLTPRGNDRVKTYSGGMRRRLDLSRALMPEPSALLLDEPTAGLDQDAFERFWQHLAALRTQMSLTLVVATHRPEEAARCDRLVMIDQGKAVHSGTPEATVRALGQDMLVVYADAPAEIAGQLQGRFGLVTRILRDNPGEVAAEVPAGEDGARMLVRVVESFELGRLHAVALRRPTLADAFTKLTGGRLEGELVKDAA